MDKALRDVRDKMSALNSHKSDALKYFDHLNEYPNDRVPVFDGINIHNKFGMKPRYNDSSLNNVAHALLEAAEHIDIRSVTRAMQAELDQKDEHERTKGVDFRRYQTPVDLYKVIKSSIVQAEEKGVAKDIPVVNAINTLSNVMSYLNGIVEAATIFNSDRYTFAQSQQDVSAKNVCDSYALSRNAAQAITVDPIDVLKAYNAAVKDLGNAGITIEAEPFGFKKLGEVLPQSWMDKIRGKPKKREESIDETNMAKALIKLSELQERSILKQSFMERFYPDERQQVASVARA